MLKILFSSSNIRSRMRSKMSWIRNTDFSRFETSVQFCFSIQKNYEYCQRQSIFFSQNANSLEWLILLKTQQQNNLKNIIRQLNTSESHQVFKITEPYAQYIISHSAKLYSQFRIFLFMVLAGLVTSGIIFYGIEQSRTRLHIILLLCIAVSHYTN